MSMGGGGTSCLCIGLPLLGETAFLKASETFQAGLEIVPFLQSGTDEKCAGMQTFVISRSDELANLRAILVQRSLWRCQFLLRDGSFLLWIGMPSMFNFTPVR